MSSSAALWIRQFNVVCWAALLISGCGHEPVRRLPPKDVAAARVTVPTPGVKTGSVGERAAVVAVNQVGVPYRYGGASKRGFDCSGLVHYAYSRVGRRLPRTTDELWRRLSPVPAKGLRVGDVLFFRIDGDISHVGLYLGNRRFVHAPASGRTVSVETLDSGFYRRAFVRGGRPADGSHGLVGHNE